MNDKNYTVYIGTNYHNSVFYIGVTNNLLRRSFEHKNKLIKGFTSKYNIDQLVYYEEFDNEYETMLREKQIKGWTRAKKETLIRTINPTWKNLSESWF